MRKVRGIMSAAPVCMGPDDSVSAAARIMKQHGAGTVLVLAGGRPGGLLTDRDITVRVLAGNRDAGTAPIGGIGGDLALEEGLSPALCGVPSARPGY